VNTLPPRLASEAPIDSETQITHLFGVEFARVVAFQVSGPVKSGPNSRSSSIGGGELSQRTSIISEGTSPTWSSPTERTVAAGK
jgi:hypothetical protein